MTYPLRPNVCMLLYNQEGKLLLGERLGEPEVWQLPQGGIEEGSSAEECALRELHEELGVESVHLRLTKKLIATHSYTFNKPKRYGKNVWSGQTQTFCLVEFLGKDADIKLARFEAEFSSFRWCTPEEVRALAEPKRLAGYLEPLREFEEWRVRL